MTDIEALRAQLSCASLIRSIDAMPQGRARIETVFKYPDGASIDVFFVKELPLLPNVKLTDLGQTMAWLLDLQIKPWLSAKRRAFIEDVLRVYDASQNGGALEIELPTDADLAAGVIRLAQACLRVADLTFTRRSSLQGSFSDEMESFLSDAELRYEPDVEIVGRFGRPVRIDYQVLGERTKSNVIGLSPTVAYAHTAVNEAFRRWYDLPDIAPNESRVTVIDDRHGVYRDDDLLRLRNVSDVVPLSERDALQALLAA